MNSLRLLAYVCQVCPVCILARKYPRGRIARLVVKEKPHCPFCKAYDEAKEQGLIK